MTDDIILHRRDEGFAYHLAVVVDDAFQGITEVTRGADLLPATPLQVTLQHLLGLPTPAYHHHRLILDDQGKRLAKRDDARALSKYRAEGAPPQTSATWSACRAGFTPPTSPAPPCPTPPTASPQTPPQNPPTPNRCVITLRTSSPFSSMAIILYQVSKISRP